MTIETIAMRISHFLLLGVLHVALQTVDTTSTHPFLSAARRLLSCHCEWSDFLVLEISFGSV